MQLGIFSSKKNVETEENQPSENENGSISDIINNGLSDTQLYILGGLSTIGLSYAGYRFFSRRIKYPETAASNIRVTLNDGHRMPLLGVGLKYLWTDLRETVYNALNAGIRNFHLGSDLEMIAIAGSIFRETRIDRSELWLTISIPPEALGHAKSAKYVQQALAALKMEYIDLVLVGWVGASWRERSNHARDKILRRDSWRALSSAHKDGVVRSIGLEHYNKTFLMEICGSRGQSLPAVVLCEMQPKLPQTDFLHFCQKQNIQCFALEPFGGGKLFEDESIMLCSQKFKNVSEMQLLIEFHRQRKTGLYVNVEHTDDFEQLVSDIFAPSKPLVGLMVEIAPLETASFRYHKANPDLWEV